jgi:outer membrane receptor protein involved in Fe transport
MDIRRAPLSAALAEFARETDTEILYEPSLVGGYMAPPVRGMLSRREALSRLLARSRIGFRKRGDSYVLFRILPVAPAAADNHPAAEEGAVPEILVIGRRSQNADIRRTENDIQPYKVLSAGEVLSSGRDDIDQVIRARETSNTHVEIPGDVSAAADTRSAVDLRGLGTSRTLVLVDGRRLPSIPTQRFDGQQANLNGIPLSAVERIETLTGTAGGIYGPGALGGVVNVVLKRDFEGVSLRATSGITSRMDARTIGFEANLGFTSDRGTRVMVAGGMHIAHPLQFGDRDFALRQRSLQFSNDPAGYLGQRLEPLPTGRFFPASNVVGIRSLSGENLRLDPQFGGASLGSPYTFVPIGLAGPRLENINALRENAGRLKLSLPDDLSGTRRFLLPRSSTKSGIFSLRQSFGDGVEAYIDGIMLQTEGTFEGSDQEPLPVISADAPTNPFSQAIQVSYPNPGFVLRINQRLRAHRLTAGIVVRLAGDWSASGDYSLGATHVTREKSFRTLNDDGVAALAYGEPAQPSYPVLDPLGPWGDFITAVELYRAPGSQLQPLENRFRSGNLRIGGPLVELGGGQLTSSAQVEWRQELVPEGNEVHRYPLSSSPFDLFLPPISKRRQSVSSAYGELRAPLTSDRHPFFLLRDLTLQLALRHDRSVARFPQTFRTALSVIRNLDYPTRSERSAVTYTAGGRFFPLPSLMIRASAATGELPPNIASLETFLGAFQGIRPELADRGAATALRAAKDFSSFCLADCRIGLQNALETYYSAPS